MEAARRKQRPRSRQEAETRAEELRRQIWHHRKRYFVVDVVALAVVPDLAPQLLGARLRLLAAARPLLSPGGFHQEASLAAAVPRAPAVATWRRGSVRMKRAPSPPSLSTAIEPPCACRMRAAIGRPSPVPPPRLEKNTSKMRSRSSGRMPGPSSSMVATASPCGPTLLDIVT